MRRLIPILALLLGLGVLSGCSKESKPYEPIPLREGRVSIYNQSGVRIRILEFTQQRGNNVASMVLNRRINSGFNYYFKNLLDGGEIDIFPGGDYIVVHYIADVPNPGDPSRPLFDQTFDHIVDGITVYYVKSGGRYTVHP